MKEIIIALVVGAVLIATGFIIGQSLAPSPIVQPLGGTIGSDVLNQVQFYDQAIFSCARIYQKGATTNASTTYYLVASTTIGTSGQFNQYLPMLATSTKPTNCP